MALTEPHRQNSWRKSRFWGLGNRSSNSQIDSDFQGREIRAPTRGPRKRSMGEQKSLGRMILFFVFFGKSYGPRGSKTFEKKTSNRYRYGDSISQDFPLQPEIAMQHCSVLCLRNRLISGVHGGERNRRNRATSDILNAHVWIKPSSPKLSGHHSLFSVHGRMVH